MTPDLPAVEIAIVEKTNLFRRSNKLGELRRNPKLDRAAKAFARYLARSGRFSHTADGRKPAQRIRAAGYRYCQVAENLALNVDSRGFRAQNLASQAMTGWKNSPGHRRNMLRETVTEIGVGVAKAADEHRYLSVQLFGRPETLRYRFRIRNEARRSVSYSFAGQALSAPAQSIMTHTACVSGELWFPKAAQRGGRAGKGVRFSTSAGDTFVVKRTGATLQVRHTPRVN